MKLLTCVLLISTIMLSCNTATTPDITGHAANPIVGTWKLLSGTLIEKGDTTVTDYSKDKSFIKIINESHFAFLEHDLEKGKDSATASFSSGGGSYTLKDSTYTEHLEYCTAREWEGNDFTFTISMIGDTLIQRGIEKVESAGVDLVNIEKYIKAKN